MLRWWGLRCSGQAARLIGIGYGGCGLWVRLDNEFLVLYAPGMGETGKNVLSLKTNRAIRKDSLDNRLSAVELRATIHESGVAYLAIKMAKTGRRPVYNEDEDEVVWEDMSEAAHVDMIKFIVKKVLGDAKDIVTVAEKSLDKWANLIQMEAEPVKGKS